MKLHDVAFKLSGNKTIKNMFAFLFYATLGKRPLTHITGHMNEFSSLIVIATLALGIDITDYKLVVIIGYIAVIFIFAAIGIVYKKLGFQHAEDYVHAMRNPVNREILEGVRETRDNMRTMMEQDKPVIQCAICDNVNLIDKDCYPLGQKLICIKCFNKILKKTDLKKLIRKK